MTPFDAASVPSVPECSATVAPAKRRAMLGYIEDMLLELAHMAAGAGETALSATLAVAAIQAGCRAEAAEPRGG